MQFVSAFERIEIALDEASLNFASLVVVTRYQIGLRGHCEQFQSDWPSYGSMGRSGTDLYNRRPVWCTLSYAACAVLCGAPCTVCRG